MAVLLAMTASANICILINNLASIAINRNETMIAFILCAAFAAVTIAVLVDLFHFLKEVFFES